MTVNPQRPIRSLALNYYAPTDLERLHAAFTMGADAVGFDLEDHVARARLPEARANVRSIVEQYGAEHTIFVRVNEIDSEEIHDDLEAVVCSGVHAINLPKFDSPADIARLDVLLSTFERRAGVEPGSIWIMPFLETAATTRLAFEVATASPRVAYLGGVATRNGDPAVSIGYLWTEEMAETSYIRQKVLLDARAAGIPFPLGGLWNPRELGGLHRFAVETRNIGYTGMVVLPIEEHVQLVNEIFTPSFEELDYWSRALPALEAAEPHTDVQFDGVTLPPNKAKWGRGRVDLGRAYGVIDAEGRPRPVGTSP